jgi:hypothetical protein
MIIESGLVKAGLVKTGLVRAISNINTRYLRRNEGTTDYISHSAATVDRIVMDVYPSAGNVGLPTGAPAVTNNVLQTIDFAYTGTISELYKNGASYFAGIMANVKYYLNGTLIRDYPLDDNSDILRNRATVLGGELWNGVSDFPADTNVTAATGTTAGASYLTTISGLSGGEDFRFSGQSGFESVGNGVFVLTAPGSSMQFRSIGVSESGVTISIRQADGYGTVINGNASDWGLFQQQATGEWLGPELVVNGGFDTDSDWVKGAGWSIGDGVASGDGLQVSASNIQQNNILNIGTVGRLRYELLNISVGSIQPVLGGSGAGLLRTINGAYAEDVTVAGDSNLYMQQKSLFNGSIDNVSVKEVLNVA